MERIYVLGIVALFVSVPLAELACMELKLATLAVVAAIVEWVVLSYQTVYCH